ncbi:MAG TPA: NADH-quinone oxidoreductase subunit NuoH [Aggregatilineales bacterium]|nr:NADH-quinone oxidoreductase subunit NuoH [Aggregatilineales bacterium]
MIDFLVSQGWSKDVATGVALLLGVIAVSSFGLVWVIFGIWLERKFAGRVQDRLGPNRTGPFGLFQTFADLGKLLTKEDITPEGADKFIFNFAPLLSVVAVILIWAVVPFSKEWIGADVNVGVLYFTAVGSLGTLSILLAGWGSNNKYALLGAFRVIAALISYEVPMILSILIPVILAGTMSMQGIVEAQHIWYVFIVPVTAVMFFTSSLAEIGRSPFDLIEAESEIVAGFNIEYSGMKFGMFFAAEFLHAFTISVLTAILFFGGWRGIGASVAGAGGDALGFVWLFIKSVGLYLLVMLIRNTVPRIRIDHMMSLNWKILVPLSLVNLIMVAILAKVFQPDYAGQFQIAANATGLGALLYQFFGVNIVAELPRAIALLIANLLLWVVVSAVLHRFAILDRRRVQDWVEPATVAGEHTASAPAPGR